MKSSAVKRRSGFQSPLPGTQVSADTVNSRVQDCARVLEQRFELPTTDGSTSIVIECWGTAEAHKNKCRAITPIPPGYLADIEGPSPVCNGGRPSTRGSMLPSGRVGKKGELATEGGGAEG